MFGCILYSVHVQNDCNCVCVCVCVLGMLLCACADCMVLCVLVHVLTAWLCVCLLTSWLCVLVHPCVPTDCPVHVHVMHAYHVQAGCHIIMCICSGLTIYSKFCSFLVYRYKYFQSQVTETDTHIYFYIRKSKVHSFLEI